MGVCARQKTPPSLSKQQRVNLHSWRTLQNRCRANCLINVNTDDKKLEIRDGYRFEVAPNRKVLAEFRVMNDHRVISTCVSAQPSLLESVCHTDALADARLASACRSQSSVHVRFLANWNLSSNYIKQGINEELSYLIRFLFCPFFGIAKDLENMLMSSRCLCEKMKRQSWFFAQSMF